MGQFITETIGVRPPDDEMEAQEQSPQEDCVTPEMTPLGDQDPLELFTLDNVRAAAAAGHAVLAHILPVLEERREMTRQGRVRAAYDDSPVAKIRGESISVSGVYTS